MDKIAPKKSLGQNFLIDKNISRKIVSLLDLQSQDYVLEIGPGTGALTELLLANDINLTAVELDKRAVELLNSKFTKDAYPNFKLVLSDIRDFNIYEYAGQNKIKSIGNIPYYISADILFQLFENAQSLDRTIIMVQKEVAKRIVASPNSKDYGIISVAAGLIAESNIAFDVPATCFYPVPKVTSAIVHITYKNNLPAGITFRAIMKFVKAAFSQRRKTLRNSLRSYLNSYPAELSERFIATHEHELTLRAEALSVEQFIQLYSDLISK